MANGLRQKGGNPSSPPYTHDGGYEWDKDLDLSARFDASGEFDRYGLVETFQQTPGLNADLANATEATRVPRNRDFEVLGTNATSALVTFGTTTGGIVLTTDTGSNDQIIILPHLDTKQTAWSQVKWGTENQTEWECILRVGASIEDLIIWAGLKLTNTSVVATDADQVFFRFDTVVDNWEATTSINGTDTETDTGVVVAVNTTYKLKIAIDENRVARFYINGDLVHTTAALKNDIDLIPYVGVQTTTTAAKSIGLIKERISRIVFE